MKTELYKGTTLWRLGQDWALTTTVSIALGLFLGALINFMIWRSVHIPLSMMVTNPFPGLILAGIITGSLCGIAQQLMLHKYEVHEKGWLLVTTLGWMLALVGKEIVFNIVDDLIVAGVVGGAIIGTGQWLLLRRNVPKSGWWILAWVISGCLTFGGILSSSWLDVLTPITIGLIIGLSTGITLSLLVRPILQVKPA